MIYTSVSENPVFHNRSKHIDVRYHYCREIISNKIIKINYLPSEDMPADTNHENKSDLTRNLHFVGNHKIDFVF